MEGPFSVLASGAVLPPCVACKPPGSGSSADHTAPSTSVSLCGPALLALAGRPARVVVLQRDTLILDALVSHGSDVTGCLRFDLPAARLRIGVADVHVLVPSDDGPRRVHSAQLLAFPPDAAVEVARLFRSMTTEVGRFFAATAAAAAAAAPAAPAVAGAPGAHDAAADEDAPVVPSPAACYAYDHFFAPFVRSWAAVLDVPPGAAPAAEATAAAAAAAAEPPPLLYATAAAAEDALNAYRRLLDYLLEHELFACGMLLIGLQPALARAALSLGLDVPLDGGLLAALSRAAAGSGGARGSGSGGGGGNNADTAAAAAADASIGGDWDDDDASVLLRHLQERQATAAAAAAAMSGRGSPAAALASLTPGSPRSPACDGAGADDGDAAAAQRRIDLSAELERLEARFAGELPLIGMRSPRTTGAPPAAAEAETAAAAAPAAPPGGNAADDDGCCGAAAGPSGAAMATAAAHYASLLAQSSAKVAEWDDGGPSAWLAAPPPPSQPLPPRPAPRAAAAYAAGANQMLPPGVTPAALLLATARGFAAPSAEAAYGEFKSTYSHMLDATALIYSFATWLTCLRRSVSAPRELAVLVVYALLFFAPYIVMLTARGAFMRRREALLVAARASSILFISAIKHGARGWMAAAWVGAVEQTATLHLSHGVLLPACQQVRFGAALAIATAHFVGDASMLSMGLPAAASLLHSAAIQVTALAISAALDARARCAFLRHRARIAAAAGGGAWGGGGGAFAPVAGPAAAAAAAVPAFAAAKGAKAL